MIGVRDKFIGSLFGCAVGDALGAPFEGTMPSLIHLEPAAEITFSKIPGYPLGQYTDDTQMTLAAVRAICRARRVDGAEIAAEFAKLWTSGEIVGAGAGCSEGVSNFIRGISWHEAGAPEGKAGNGAAMRAAPVGLWNYNHPDRIEQDAKASSIITHKDPRSIAGALAVAKAVQLCLDSEDIDPVDFLGAVGALIRPTSILFSKSIDDLAGWLNLEPPAALPFIYASGEPEIGPRRPGYVTGYVIPTVLCSFYFFLRTPRSFMQTVVGSIGAGGDTDTTAAIAGSISGAFNGIGAIPQRLVAGLKDSKEILALAEQFHSIAVSPGEIAKLNSVAARKDTEGKDT